MSKKVKLPRGTYRAKWDLPHRERSIYDRKKERKNLLKEESMDTPIVETSVLKTVKSTEYNYVFNRENGDFLRWGKTKKEDPQYSPLGPEIADIEISTICGNFCTHCYKTNSDKGKNMTFDDFEEIFLKLPKNLTQIAFGIGDLNANPDLYKIMKYCRNNSYNLVVPNITINGKQLTDHHIDNLSSICGAVAVSHYSDKDCFGAVDALTRAGLEQVNIHKLLCIETLSECHTLLQEAKKNPLLERLNAIVFLLLKPKGKRNRLHQIRDFTQLQTLFNEAMDLEIPIGFDSCSAPYVMRALESRPNASFLRTLIEPCESTLFSIYINVDGEVFPCSFCEDTLMSPGIKISNIENFMKDVWFSPKIVSFRETLLEKKRNCPAFNLHME